MRDEALGRRGTGLQERPGFGQRLAAVWEGKVGAVGAFEAARLARNNRDWHHVLALCALTDPWRLDEDGLYDPRQRNERFVLGMKGSSAADALALMRQRARDALAAKSQRGHVRWDVPVGFVRTTDERREKSADRQVQHAVAGGFGKFRARGSARQTMRGYRAAPLPRPEGQPGTAGRDMLWRLPSSHRLSQLLTKPSYAGALVSGRTEAKPVIAAGRARQRTRRQKPRERWRILLLDHQSGSISGEEFWQPQQTLEANRHLPEDAAGGAARRGPAVLSGL
jgi:DNA invertase Pin-like site-specific DNA recombinase